MEVPSTIKSYCTTYIPDNLQSNFVELSLDIYNAYKLEAKD